MNPLLGDAVALRRGVRVAAWASPADGLWPSAAAELRVEPLRLRVGRGAGLSRALEVLKIVNARVAAAANAAELAVDTTPLRAELRADGTIVAHRLDLSVSESTRFSEKKSDALKPLLPFLPSSLHFLCMFVRQIEL